MVEWVKRFARSTTVPDLPPALAAVGHLATWFSDLSGSRTYTIISGAMGGGGIVYNAINCMELEAWGRITGNYPTWWELDVLRAMDRVYIGEKSEQANKSAGKAARRHQGLGEYCQNENIESCRKTFGENLKSICATCPD